MTTVNLELSRQLQERWPEWKVDFYWVITMTTNWHISWYPDGKSLPNDVDTFIAPQLDELRVFALELISKTYAKDSSKYDSYLIDTQSELSQVIIKGCDPTAEWILKTFGGK